MSSLSMAQDTVLEEISGDLQKARQTLAEQREGRAAERLELSAEVTELTLKLREKRRQVGISRRSVTNNKEELRVLRQKEYASSEEVRRLSDILRIYGLSLLPQRLPGELEDSRLDGISAKLTDENTALLNRFAILEYGMERLESSFGGDLVTASVTDEEAKVMQGNVAVFGPLRWFVSEDGKVAGSYTVSSSKVVASLDSADADTAKLLVDGQPAMASIDITGGKAKALASIDHSPLQLVKKGGAWVYPILSVALLALVCAVIKFFQLIGIRRPSAQWLQTVTDSVVEGDGSSAVQQAASLKHPLAKVLPECIEALPSGVEVAEEVMYEHLIDVRDALRRWLPFIAITAAVSPLLGLLGTVSGLIHTFSVIAVEGTGEAQSISAGISEALVTTLFGLAVAIPAFMMHALLSRRAKGIEQTTERLSLGVLNAVRKADIK